MSNDNVENTTDKVSDELNSGVGQVAGGAAKHVASKAGQAAFKKALGTAAVSALKSSLIALAGTILIPMLLALLVVIVIYGSTVQDKQYSIMADNNSIGSDSYEVYNGKESSVSTYSRFRSKSEDTKYSTSSKSIEKIVLSEDNQAIENYHFYNAAKSAIDNKVYIPLKGIDTEKKNEEMYNQLVKKGVLEEDGNERFISEDSLTDVQKAWEKQNGNSGGKFSWSDTKLKKKLDKKINKGITVKGFDDKHIGSLEKIEDEKEKVNIKDAYNREVYFQLPEELLGALNKSIYDDEFIYDAPFVKGVKYTYKKKEDEKEEEKKGKVKQSKKEEDKINKDSADNSVYTAELFDKQFAKKDGLLKGKGQQFIDYSNKYDIDAGLLVAIAIHESGYGTSDLAKHNYNFFGMKATSKTYRKFNSVDEGIEGGASYLSRMYISQGITSLQAIGNKYCDPPEEWIQKVGVLYKQVAGRDYDGSLAGQGYGSNLTEFRSVPEYEIKLDSYGIKKTSQTQKYGLGTVFLYRPAVEIQVKRGYKLDQTLTTSKGEKIQVGEDKIIEDGKKGVNQSQSVIRDDGRRINKSIEYETKKIDDGNGGKKTVQVKRVYEEEILYTPNATATPIEEVDAKVTYVLDKAITFAGVYEFEYGLQSEEVGSDNTFSERPIEGALDKSGNQLAEFSKTESKTIKIYEKPISVKNSKVNTKYMDNYLSNFSASVPKKIMNKFDINKLVNSFKGQKRIETVSQDSATGTSEAVDNIVEEIEKNMRDDAEKIGAKYGIDPSLLLTIVYVESKGNHHSKRDGSQFWSLGQIGHKNTTDSHRYMPGYKLTDDLATDDRWPHCPANGHDEAEHQRVEEFHLEYLAKRHTHEMKKYIKNKYGKNAEKGLTEEEIRSAIPVGLMSYNIGGGNVSKIRKIMGYDDSIFDPDGVRFGDIMRKHNIGNPEGNGDHLKKLYRDYKLFSNGGISMQDAVSLNVYDPTLWFDLGDIGKGGEAVDSASLINTGTNGAAMNMEKVELYMKYEETGGSTSKAPMKGSVVKHIDQEEADLIRNTAIGMIENQAAYDVVGSKNVFWDKRYAKEYFEEGLPAKPLYGEELSSAIWGGKIRESSYYTGDKDSIVKLSKMYGTEVYKIIKRAVGQEGKEFGMNGSGPYTFDHSGLLWYVFNYNSKVKYFDKDTVEGYYKTITTEVPDGDIRPGDIIFYTDNKDREEPNKVGVYLGQKAYLYINEDLGEVSIGKYSDLQENTEYKILDERRVLKYSSGQNDGVVDGIVGQLPADLVKGDWANPLGAYPYRTTSPIGYRTHPVTGEANKYHRGVDWAAPNGTPVYSAKAGKVIESFADGKGPGSKVTYGAYVVVDHLDGYTTLYAHLNKRYVEKDDKVAKGQIIGAVGNTGRSSGNHLHLEVAKDSPGHFGGKGREAPEGNLLDPDKIFKKNS